MFFKIQVCYISRNMEIKLNIVKRNVKFNDYLDIKNKFKRYEIIQLLTKKKVFRYSS